MEPVTEDLVKSELSPGAGVLPTPAVALCRDLMVKRKRNAWGWQCCDPLQVLRGHHFLPP